jgi:hypothetical protein
MTYICLAASPLARCLDVVTISELVRSLTPQNPQDPHGETRLGGGMRPQPHMVLSMIPLPLLHSFTRHLALYVDERELLIVSSSVGMR